MDKSFYVLKGEVDSTQKAIDSLDNLFTLWNEYLALKLFMEKYKRLQGEDRKTIYHKHTAKIERYKTLNDHLINMRENSVNLKSTQWEKERNLLQDNVSYKC